MNKQANKQTNEQPNKQPNEQTVIVEYVPNQTKIKEIKRDLHTALAAIIAECYLLEDSFNKDLTIKGVKFKIFINDQCDEIIKLQQKLNKIM